MLFQENGLNNLLKESGPLIFFLDLLQVDLLASGVSDKVARGRHMKSDEGLFWKSIFFQEVGASIRRRCPLDKRINSLIPSVTSAMKFVNWIYYISVQGIRGYML